jgi:2-dehydro-3-deoxyphosphooctonate aldolase (KDO 8-P synthase)
MSSIKTLVLAGPCQIESRDHALMMAKEIVAIADRFSSNIQIVYKSSFDKANRSSIKGNRGVGIDQGLDILREVKNEFGLPIVTDVHETFQVDLVAEVVDVIQIPAFLCRQTDLLLAAGKSDKVVNIKKGQFIAPSDMQFAADKVLSTGNDKILLCERGTCFGYRDLIVDFRGILQMQDLQWPVVFDVTHSCMSLGGVEGVSGGMRRFALPYLRAAAAIGCQAFFLEVHNNPDSAPSDAKVMLDLPGFTRALETIKLFKDIESRSEDIPEESTMKINDRLIKIINFLKV